MTMMIGLTSEMGKRGRPQRRSEDPLMTFLIITWLLMAAALIALLIYVITDDSGDGDRASTTLHTRQVLLMASEYHGDTSFHDASL